MEYIVKLKVEELLIETETYRTRILLGETLDNLTRYIPDDNAVIITDTNVGKLYSDRYPGFPVIRIGTGEKIKTLDTVNEIYDNLVNIGVDRSTTIVGIGGGVVCDIAGFVASTYLRGLTHGFVSTSLLSQVDASLGGKTGVNFRGFKNLVGTFNHPAFVLCDFEMLDTLPEKEYLSGFAEIIKHAAIRNRNMFEKISRGLEDVSNRNKELLKSLVSSSVKIKSDIVKADEWEFGPRRILNFGHTFGHALEKMYGLTHGEAVSMGMIMATEFSVSRGLADPSEMIRIEELLRALNLVRNITIDKKLLSETLLKDKKKYGDHLFFVFLTRIGIASVEKVSLKDVRKFIHEYL